MSGDVALQMLKSVDRTEVVQGNRRGQMRRGRLATEHVKPGSNRALQARDAAMRDRAKLQLVKRGAPQGLSRRVGHGALPISRRLQPGCTFVAPAVLGA